MGPGPEQAIARVTFPDGRAAGLAFVIDQNNLLTCAHVVNTALGRPLRDASTPPQEAELTLEFEFGGADDSPASLKAKIVAWLPPRGAFDHYDVARLLLAGPLPPGISPLRLAPGDPKLPLRVQMWGPVPGRATAGHVVGQLMGGVAKGRYQIDQERYGAFRVVRGFSGGPVWQPDTGEVVGLLQASSVNDDTATDAYLLGVEVLAQAASSLDRGRTSGDTEPAPLWRLTVLQLPDLRFGPHHCFGTGLPDEQLTDGSLAGHLLRDVERLRHHHGLSPDLVVAAGDLTESGLPAECQAAGEFLVRLGNGLGLGMERVIAVPGDHDVNRKAAQAYLLMAESEGEEPKPPYWPKWKSFATMLSRITGRGLPKDRPWTYHEYPDLKVVVAAMNSTLADSHRRVDHFGRLGDDQLREFAERMTAPGLRDWLRIGVVHHAICQGDGCAGAAVLRDTDRFVEILAGALHLVLHGHSDGAGIWQLGETRLPVVGTGCAADRGESARPPARYRLLTIGTSRVRVWSRQYAPQRRRFIGDSSVSDDGEYWYQDLPVRLGEARCGLAESKHHDPAPRRPMAEALKALERVAEVARLRVPGARIEIVPSHSVPGEAGYLRMSAPLPNDPTRLAGGDEYPIGVLTGTATDAALRRFQAVAARFRVCGASWPAKLVYFGAPAPVGVRQLARREGITLLSFAEFQLGFELRPFARRQHDRLLHDVLYPPDSYLPQRFTDVTPGLAAQADHDLLERLRAWLAVPSAHVVVVLGQFGYGKTFLLRELARRMHASGDTAVPVLVQLGQFDGAHDLETMVATALLSAGAVRFDQFLFRYLLREGRIALLFDGFDEWALRRGCEPAAARLDTITQALSGRAKIVLTSREQDFRTNDDVRSVLGGLSGGAGHRLVNLEGFDDGQVLAFLANRLGDASEARRRFELLTRVPDLLDLSRNPRMLDLVVRIDERRLRSVVGGSGGIALAALYRELALVNRAIPPHLARRMGQ